MKITCQNCEELLSQYLCDLPSEWRSQIVKAICESLNNEQTLTCTEVKRCETLTSLSAFRVVGEQICITYKDENKVSTTRCFNIPDLQTCYLDGTDPNCITDQETWDAMTCTEKVQAIIDYACDCVAITTSTTTTTTSPSTTTTTTL